MIAQCSRDINKYSRIFSTFSIFSEAENYGKVDSNINHLLRLWSVQIYVWLWRIKNKMKIIKEDLTRELYEL